MTTAIDLFSSMSTGLDSGLTDLATVTPVDAVGDELPNVTRALYVGVAGDLTVITKGGQTVTLKAVSGWLPLRVRQVTAAGMTATDIVAGW